MADKKKWIQDAVPKSSKGKLHKALHVPQGKKIPEKKLAKGAKSKNPKIRKEVNLAETLKKFSKRK